MLPSSVGVPCTCSNRTIDQVPTATAPIKRHPTNPTQAASKDIQGVQHLIIRLKLTDPTCGALEPLLSLRDAVAARAAAAGAGAALGDAAPRDATGGAEEEAERDGGGEGRGGSGSEEEGRGEGRRRENEKRWVQLHVYL